MSARRCAGEEAVAHCAQHAVKPVLVLLIDFPSILGTSAQVSGLRPAIAVAQSRNRRRTVAIEAAAAGVVVVVVVVEEVMVVVVLVVVIIVVLVEVVVMGNRSGC